MEHRVRNVPVSINIYAQLTILLRNLAPILDSVLYVLLNLPFWFVVIAVWINIRAASQTKILFRYFLIIVAAVLVFFVFVLILSFIELIKTLKRLVRKQNQNAFRFWIRRKTKYAKYCWKQSKATREICFVYGPFTVITEDFAMEYFHILTLRCFDAILVFEA